MAQPSYNDLTLALGRALAAYETLHSVIENILDSADVKLTPEEQNEISKATFNYNPALSVYRQL